MHVNTNLTVKQLKLLIFKMIRPLIQVPKSVIENIPEADQTEEKVLETEYNYFFEKKWSEYKDDIGNPLYKLQIYNNTNEVSGMFTKGRDECEFCKKKHTDNCTFNFEDDVILQRVINKIRDARDFSVNIHWRDKGQKANLKSFEQAPIVRKLSSVPE